MNKPVSIDMSLKPSKQLNGFHNWMHMCAGYLAYKEELEQIQRGKNERGGAAIEAKKSK